MSEWVPCPARCEPIVSQLCKRTNETPACPVWAAGHISRSTHSINRKSVQYLGWARWPSTLVMALPLKNTLCFTVLRKRLLQIINVCYPIELHGEFWAHSHSHPFVFTHSATQTPRVSGWFWLEIRFLPCIYTNGCLALYMYIVHVHCTYIEVTSLSSLIPGVHYFLSMSDLRRHDNINSYLLHGMQLLLAVWQERCDWSHPSQYSACHMIQEAWGMLPLVLRTLETTWKVLCGKTTHSLSSKTMRQSFHHHFHPFWDLFEDSVSYDAKVTRFHARNGSVWEVKYNVVSFISHFQNVLCKMNVIINEHN